MKITKTRLNQIIQEELELYKKTTTEAIFDPNEFKVIYREVQGTLQENPAALAAAAMAATKLRNDQGEQISAKYVLDNPKHKQHEKAQSMFQRLKDKFSSKKESTNEDRSASILQHQERELEKAIAKGDEDEIYTLRNAIAYTKSKMKREGVNEYTIRPATGTGVSKKAKAVIHKALDKIWKKFGSLGGGFVETGSEDVAKYFYVNYQVARKSKRGKFRDWLHVWVDRKGNITAQPKGGKSLGVLGNLKDTNKVAKALKAWSDKDLYFGESVNEALDPYKDFGTDNSWEKNYDLNLGSFVDHYQKFIKFMKKHKEVPDKNKRAWANAIREKVGRSMLNGHMSQMSNIMDLLEKGEKYRKLKDEAGWVHESVNERAGDRQRNKGDVYKGGFSDNKGNNTEMYKSKKDGTFYIWVKSGGAEAYMDLPKNIKDRSKADDVHNQLTTSFRTKKPPKIKLKSKWKHNQLPWMRGPKKESVSVTRSELKALVGEVMKEGKFQKLGVPTDRTSKVRLLAIMKKLRVPLAGPKTKVGYTLSQKGNKGVLTVPSKYFDDVIEQMIKMNISVHSA